MKDIWNKKIINENINQFIHKLGLENRLDNINWFKWINISLFLIMFGIVIFLLLIYMSKKMNLVDVPDKERKRHKVPTPYTGGIGIFMIFTVGIWSYHYLYSYEWTNIFSIFYFGYLFMLLLGFLDDKIDIKPLKKLIFQFLIIVLIVFILPMLNNMFLVTNINSIENSLYLLIIIIIISLTLSIFLNTYNIVDGVDGLLGSVTLLIIMSITIISIAEVNTGFITYAYVLGISIFVFLIFNLPPAKIFLGDNGSLSLGYAILLFFIFLFEEWDIQKIIVMLLILGYPIIDTFNVIIRRLKNKQSILKGDRSHIHHLLLNKTSSVPKTLTIIITFNILLQIFGVSFYFLYVY